MIKEIFPGTNEINPADNAAFCPCQCSCYGELRFEEKFDEKLYVLQNN